MTAMSVTPDIDQFTIILQPTDLNFEFEEWDEHIADNLINTFLIKSKLLTVFPNYPIAESDGGILKSYIFGYELQNSPFYFRIAYHPTYIKMGISIYFSAYAWAEYRKNYETIFNEKIHLHTFFQMISDDEYSFRLSRIDMAVDFKNENVDIAKIHRSLESGRTEFRYNHV